MHDRKLNGCRQRLLLARQLKNSENVASARRVGDGLSVSDSLCTAAPSDEIGEGMTVGEGVTVYRLVSDG